MTFWMFCTHQCRGTGMMRRAFFFLYLVLAAVPAHASAIFTLGNNPQPGEENILFSGGTGTAISGVTASSSVTVNFSSTTDTLIASAAGSPSQITADDGLLNRVAISVPSGTFGDLIFNPVISVGGPAGGTLTVTAATNDGVFSFEYTLGSGNNFLTITTAGGERLSSVALSAPDGFNTLSQVRISDVNGGAVVPEPASLCLFGLGLSGIGARRWRRHKQS